MPRGTGLLLCLIFCALLMAGCSAHDTSPKALIAKRCYRCHTPERIHKARKSAEGWLITVNKMATYASGVIPEKEIPIIIDYLASTQGIDRRTGTQASGNVEEKR
jgi:hypothetical protein